MIETAISTYFSYNLQVFASESDSDSDIYSSSDEEQQGGVGGPSGDESSPLLHQDSDSDQDSRNS